MSGPYPPPGYPHPQDQGGWWGGQQGSNQGGRPGQPGGSHGNPAGPGSGQGDQGSQFGGNQGNQGGQGGLGQYGGNHGGPGGPGGQYGGGSGGQGQGGGQFGGPYHDGSSGPYGVNPAGQPQFEVGHDFPTVEYSGLAGQAGGWGEPPRKRRNTGRIVVAVIAVLVIVGGVATGIVLLNQRHSQQRAASSTQSSSTQSSSTQNGQNGVPDTTAGGTSGQQQHQGGGDPTTTTGTAPADPGTPNGSSTLTLTAGACVTAQVSGNEQYKAVLKVTCGTAQSDLILAMASPTMAGCADHQYLRLTAPSTGVYCFTLDVKQGDCVDNNYLKAPCTTAPFVVLRTEKGPGSTSSCMDAVGATHWVPVGRNPVMVGCLGPTKNS